MSNKKIIFVVIVVLLAFSDFFSKKSIMDKHEQKGTNCFYVLPFFNISDVKNSGVAFGVFAKVIRSEIIALFTTTFSLMIFFSALFKKNITSIEFFAYAFISGGAIANSIDRILNGFVYDFLDFHAVGYHWPSFNLADIYIFFGVSAIIIFGNTKSFLNFEDKQSNS